MLNSGEEGGLYNENNLNLKQKTELKKGKIT